MATRTARTSSTSRPRVRTPSIAATPSTASSTTRTWTGPEPLDSDLTTATGGNRRIARRAGINMAIGALVGAIAGLILSKIPGPFEVESTGGTSAT